MRVRRVQQLPVARHTLERRFGLMAESLLFRTNDPRLLAAAEASFGRFAVPGDDREPLVINLFRETRPGRPAPNDEEADGGPGPATATEPSEPVVFRTHGSSLLISRGSADVATVDIDAGVAVGFLAASTVSDAPLVRYSFIEAMGLSMLARSRGYITLHAAGVVRDGVGIVLLGPAGAGKSTLAMACARRGYGVFAEDAVFVRVRESGLELWGMPWTQRLLPDAGDRFPELAGHVARRQANGELKIEVDLDAVYPGRAVPCASAGPVVLLERESGGPTRIEQLDEADGQAALEVLWPFDGGWTAGHARGATLLAAGGVHRLHSNGTPDAAVDALETVLGGAARPVESSGGR